MPDRMRRCPSLVTSAVAAVRSSSVRFNPAPRNPRPPMRITSRRFHPSQSRVTPVRADAASGPLDEGIRNGEEQLLNTADYSDIAG